MQNGVTLSTKENELEIKYGPYHYGTIDFKPSELAFASVKYILADLNDIRKKYIMLGFHLSEFRRCQYFKHFGYLAMEDFCAANLGMDKSAVSRCISVWENFAAVDGGHSRKMWLDDKYKEYSYSQLCEMVSMDDVQRSQVKPDMTIKQIREIKKNKSTLNDSLDELDKIIDVSQNASPVATSQLRFFDYNKYVTLKGAASKNYVKGSNSNYSKYLHIFDRDGKELIPGISVNILGSDPNNLFIRLVNDEYTYFK